MDRCTCGDTECPSCGTAQGTYREPRCYQIIRFYFDEMLEKRPRTIKKNVTLAEAKAHCARADTSSHSTGPGAWFDGYEFMPGADPE